jgi:hypothetical protein
MTCNEIPCYSNDSGMKRRVMAIEHHSTFTDKLEEVNKANKIYLLKKEIFDEIGKNKLENAIVDILVENAYKYSIEQKEPPNPPSFKTTAEEVNSVNDEFTDFINHSLIITGKNKTDKINKTDMLNLYKLQFPNKYPMSTFEVLRARLKEKNIIYLHDREHKGERGCFTGVFQKQGYQCIDEDVSEIKELKNEI